MSDLMQIPAGDLEIVGFNGAPLVECGRSLPVVRRTSDGTYCVLDLARGGAVPSCHSQDEANAFRRPDGGHGSASRFHCRAFASRSRTGGFHASRWWSTRNSHSSTRPGK